MSLVTVNSMKEILTCEKMMVFSLPPDLLFTDCKSLSIIRIFALLGGSPEAS
jgi:hypothetical protein